MANPLKNEAEIYERIRNERVGIDPFIWEIIYRDVGDSISVINLIVASSVEFNEPISNEDAKRSLIYADKIQEVFNKIIHPEKIAETEGPFARMKNCNITLHPLIKELFTHYVANDVCIIKFCLSYYLDPKFPEPVPVNEAQKILTHAASMSLFLEKLREAVRPAEAY